MRFLQFLFFLNLSKCSTDCLYYETVLSANKTQVICIKPILSFKKQQLKQKSGQ